MSTLRLSVLGLLSIALAGSAHAGPFSEKLSAHKAEVRATLERFGNGEKSEVAGLHLITKDPKSYASGGNLGIVYLQYGNAMKQLDAVGKPGTYTELEQLAGKNPVKRARLALTMMQSRRQAKRLASSITAIKKSAPNGFHAFWDQLSFWYGDGKGAMKRGAGETDDAYFDRAVSASSEMANLFAFRNKLQAMFPDLD